MKKVIQKMALAVLMIFGAVAARADLGWHAVYEVNSSGTVVSGSVAALITAINTGADVKVIAYDGSTPQVWIPGFINVNSSGTAVFAHARTISVEARGDGAAQIKSAAYDIDVILNTNNVVSYVRYSKSGSKADVDSIYNFRQIWLVNY